MKLFPDDQLVGVFRGFSEGGLEFHADLALSYQSNFQNIPMHGQFLLVQLESEAEAVLGRITKLHAEGRLASSSGDDFALRALAERRQIPENLRDQYLKYRVGIRVLGVLRQVGEELVFVPSHRRLPHVGSPVAFLSDAVLREVAGHNVAGAELGFFALGEFIYSGGDDRFEAAPWMVIKSPKVLARFKVENLVSRRSFVFARAGFGKSNLIKLLFADLYETTPFTVKRGGRQAPVGTVIFDPDGEYFWPDDRGRPGLCDVPHLQDKIVVFTTRAGPSPFYQSFVASPIKLDIRRLPAANVVAIALPPDRQTQQNVIKLRRLAPGSWRSLVDVIWRDRMSASDQDVASSLNLQAGVNDAEITAAKSNMVHIVDMLHDPSSQMLDALTEALRAGKLCVVDISQMRGSRGRILGGLILQNLFEHNQTEWTKAEPKTIPVIAVIEEAQSVLSNTSASQEDPYVIWTKEGRKYDLGSLLVTQQPGSIDNELLSQGDNWFLFHLLSAADLQGVKRANSHFSDDLLSSLLNEPIPGNGVFWSSASGQSYPIPFRPLSFEVLYRPLDAQYDAPPAATYASVLKERLRKVILESQEVVPAQVGGTGNLPAGEMTVAEAKIAYDVGDQPVDALETISRGAIARLKADGALRRRLESDGVPWRAVIVALEGHLPEQISDGNHLAAQLVPAAMSEIYGLQGEGWHVEKRPSRSAPGQMVTWIATGPEPMAAPGTQEGDLFP